MIQFWQFGWTVMILLAVINLGDMWSAIEAPDWYSYVTILTALVMQTYLVVQLKRMDNDKT